MSGQRRVTLRTAWVDEETKSSQQGAKKGASIGPNCPSCGVPLKKTRSGTMFCWFCEKEYDIDPSQFQTQIDDEPKEEPQWGTPASEVMDDEEVFSPDGKKQEEEMDFEIDIEVEEEEDEEELDFDVSEEDEPEEEEDFEVEIEEGTEEVDKEEEMEIEEEEVEEEIEGAHLIEDDEFEMVTDEEEIMEEDEEEGWEDDDDDDVFDPSRYRKKNRPEELEDIENDEDFEVELDED